MPLKRKFAENSSLYLILDTQVKSYQELFLIAKQAISAGVDIIQLRDKYGDAKNILRFSREIMDAAQGRVSYIINDRVDLSLIAQSTGVHLGQDDIPMGEARQILGPNKLIGRSCQTFEQALEAQAQGADYIGFGSVFKTLTKPERNEMDLDLLNRVIKSLSIPVYAIGGIGLENIDLLKKYDVKHFAVCRDICCADDVVEKVKMFKSIINDEKQLKG